MSAPTDVGGYLNVYSTLEFVIPSVKPFRCFGAALLIAKVSRFFQLRNIFFQARANAIDRD